jgi:hypothetical protein
LKIFSAFDLSPELKDDFLKDFNIHIQDSIIEAFGKEDYSRHLEETKEKWIRETEKELLLYIKDLAKLGFVEEDKLQYQDAFGTWQDIRNYGSLDEDTLEIYSKSRFRRENQNNIDESKLKPIYTLIEEYFSFYKDEKEGYLNNILFLIADFGKGKTSFLHHFASALAQQYLKTHEGPFPVYINLNEYDKYTNSPSLGVIANYLAKRFKIDIKEEYFKKKNYYYLIDSLDECGELTETNIDRVIKDIVEIQNLDNINQRNNKIIITSRPIAVGLKEQISKYKPFKIKINEELGDLDVTDNYISVYGFKREQFDNYVEFALKYYWSNNSINGKELTGISYDLFFKISQNQKIDLYKSLCDKILKPSELKRPIFAYMIYKLIISNTDFMDLGKVGIYISFLNQLTRDAKHKDDLKQKISLKEEFVYRNILNVSALLWQYKRQSGEQTSLTKADICRTIEGKELDKDNRKVLSEFSDIASVHFLSHSYFGEKENTLHFQHQSFAEILLAEYYLKVIIKYAIEEDTDVEEARIRLSIGLPTDQTVDFFKGLLTILKECVSGNPEDKGLRTKRQLLIPMLASMAINNHNKKLYSTRLNATWFETHESELFSKSKIMDKVINDFPITSKTLDKIDILCKKIIRSPKTYLLAEPFRHSILFKDELMSINNSQRNFYEVDKWFALVAGNIISTNTDNNIFFNSNIDSRYLFDMIRNWNNINNQQGVPEWGLDLFMGINMHNNEEFNSYHMLTVRGINFSYSYFKNLSFFRSDLSSCNFSFSKFQGFSIEDSNISGCKFDNVVIQRTSDTNKNSRILIYGDFSITFCFITQGLLFPEKLNSLLKQTGAGRVNFSSNYSIITNTTENEEYSFFDEYLLPLKGIFKLILLNGNSSQSILSAFKFRIKEIIATKEKSNLFKSTKEKFEELIHNLEKEVKDMDATKEVLVTLLFILLVVKSNILELMKYTI